MGIAKQKQNSGELKTRVNRCLDKLSDRDTLQMAANELESIAKALPNDSFAPFLNCLSATDSSEKSPVRRHCVRLLSVLSEAHGDALSPHLSRMVAAVLRRLRDPDSAVRAACVDAVSSIATHVNSPPFAFILKPLVDALFHEQDVNVQIGASLCLSAAVAAAPVPDEAELRRILPRVLKLVKSDCSKPKPALLSFVGSIVNGGYVRNMNLLSSVVSIAVEYLSSEDWAARKAAAEVLEKVAAVERKLATEFKGACIVALDNKRFDKVKVVREKMNIALEKWKELAGLPNDLPLSRDTSSSGWQSPVLVPESLGKGHFENGGDFGNTKPCVASVGKVDFRRNFGSRVAPFTCDNKNPDLAVVKQDLENEGEFRGILKHLMQIENQQSILLDLLQRFIGSSQMGMNSLEKRVDVLEKVLEEMSRDIAISMHRISSTQGQIYNILSGSADSNNFHRTSDTSCNLTMLDSSKI